MSFADTLRDAISDFASRGYESQVQLDDWVARIRRAAEEELLPEAQVDQELRRMLGTVYERLIDRGGIVIRHPDVSRFTVERIRPVARAELGRAIHASAGLIRLNRERAVADTIQRFAGWASSVPQGGAPNVRRRDVATATRAELQKLAWQARRVGIDQAQKFSASLDRILAAESGAIAMRWAHHYSRHPRHAHVERDGKVYLLRESWARDQDLVRPGPAGYLDDITKPGEEILCRCTGSYIASLRRLPPDMLTERGREYLAAQRSRAAA